MRIKDGARAGGFNAAIPQALPSAIPAPPETPMNISSFDDLPQAACQQAQPSPSACC